MLRIIHKLRKMAHDNAFIRRTIYPKVWYFMNKVLHWRSRLLQVYGIDILLKVQDVAAKDGVKCSPYFGTLLGLVRDGKLIKHDIDIDFVVSPEVVEIKAFYDHLKSVGFRSERIIFLNNRLLEFTMIYKELMVDFFIVGADVDKERNIYVFDDRGEVRLHSYPKIMEMTELKIVSGDIIRVPQNSEIHLTNEYGNWRIPEKNWDARRGPSFRSLLDRSKCKFQCIREEDEIDLYFETHPNIERIDGCRLDEYLLD